MERLSESQIKELAFQACEKLSKEKLYGVLGSKRACFMEFRGERIVLKNNRSVWKSPKDAKLSLIAYISTKVVTKDDRVAVGKCRYLFDSESTLVAQHLINSGDIRIVQLTQEQPSQASEEVV